jgi:hypothetical protein
LPEADHLHHRREPQLEAEALHDAIGAGAERRADLGRAAIRDDRDDPCPRYPAKDAADRGGPLIVPRNDGDVGRASATGGRERVNRPDRRHEGGAIGFETRADALSQLVGGHDSDEQVTVDAGAEAPHRTG